MEDYEVGSLGDLISGTETPGKSKVIQKQIAKHTPNKHQSNGGTGAKTPKANGKSPAIVKKTPQKRPNPSISPSKSPKIAKAKQQKVEVEEDPEDDESDEELAEEEEGSNEESADSDEESDAEIKEEVEEESDAEIKEEVEEESEDDSILDSEDDEDKAEVKEGTESVKQMHKDRTIFVGNVKVGTAKGALLKHFKKHGKIESIRLRSIAVSNPKVHKKVAIQKGELHKERKTCNAYVRYVNKEAAAEAVKQENGKEFAGLHLRVTMSDLQSMQYDDKKTLFVGNLSFKAEDEDLWKAFSPCGEIESVRIVRNRQTNVSLGFAYVNFKSNDSVQLALQMGDVTVNGRVIRISVSDFSKKGGKPGGKPQKAADEKSLFVTEFKAGVTEEQMRTAFAACGPVTRVRIVKDRETQKPAGYAFVTFGTAEAAKKALSEQINVAGSEVVVKKARNHAIGGNKHFINKNKNKSGDAGNAPKSEGKQNAPWQHKKGGRPTGGEKEKSFQGGKGNDGRIKKKKRNRGNVIKKQMVQKVAPKTK